MKEHIIFNKRALLLLALLFISVSVIRSQMVITRQMIDRMDNTLPKEQLDKAVYRCVYHFTQQVRERTTKELAIQTDSMVLDVGRNFSIYYDLNKSVRDSLHRSVTRNLDITHIRMKTNPDYDMAEYRGVVGDFFVNSHKGENSDIYKNKSKEEIITIDVTDLHAFQCVEHIPPPSPGHLPPTR